MPGARDGGKKKFGRGAGGDRARGPARSTPGDPSRESSRRATPPRETRVTPERDRAEFDQGRNSRGGGAGASGRGDWLPHGIRVVFEDADLIVVDKPHGLLSATMEGQGQAPSVFNEIKKHVRASGFKPGRSRASQRDGESQRSGTRVWVIHRLDREASGLMVFAKSLRAFDVIKEELRVRRVQRSYVAVVEGIVGSRVGEVGSVQSYLWEDERGGVHSGPTPMNVPMAGGAGGSATPVRKGGRGPLGPIGRARAQREAGKPQRDGEGLARMAVTHYRVAAHAHGRTMLELKLDTGRKHQIRVHMRELGHVIVGDRRYNAKSDPIGRVCLHARTLAFAHPVTGEALKFESPTPGAFVGLVGSDAVANSSGEVLQSIVAPPSAANPTVSLRGREARPADVSTDGPEDSDDAGWDHVAEWYEGLVGGRKSDHHERVIYPGVLRLLEPRAGMRVLDVACGEGELCRRLTQAGLDAVGVDAAPKLIGFATAAQARLESARGKGPRGSGRYAVADATRLHEVDLRGETGPRGDAREDFDAATCVMALMNMAPIEPVMAGVARWLRPGGRFVGVILHPAFRAPGQTSWQWEDGTSDEESRVGRAGPARGPRGGREIRQYRRVDAYLSPTQRAIVMNPGAEARGQAAVTTVTHHRPIQVYVRAMAQAGLMVDAMEEWASARRSEPGPRAAEEDRARREIPMFLAIRAVKADPGVRREG